MLFSQRKDELRLPDIRLDSMRVFLRPPRFEDWAQWAVLRQRNYRHLKSFEPSWPAQCLSEDFFKRRLLRQFYEWESDRGRFFLIFKKENGDLIGGINVNNICRGAAQYASLGYWIDVSHESQGFMREALSCVIQHCFEDIGLQRLNAACLSHNERSRTLLLRAGFCEEGFVRQYMQIDGQRQDHVLYGLTVGDWRAI